MALPCPIPSSHGLLSMVYTHLGQTQRPVHWTGLEFKYIQSKGECMKFDWYDPIFAFFAPVFILWHHFFGEPDGSHITPGAEGTVGGVGQK